MKSTFQAHLVNPPGGDPALYVRLRWQGRALLFDLGQLDRLDHASTLRLSHVFVSHTHMDHFVGFDQLLRVFLAREARLRIFGPPGLIANVTGKLAGYTWNLVDEYPLVLEVTEVGIEGLKEPGVSLIRGADGCVFLDGSTNRCTVHEARPEQCAAYPFWPRAMRSREDWARDVEAYCEPEAFTGGRLFTAAEIEAIVSRFSVTDGKPIGKTEKPDSGR